MDVLADNTRVLSNVPYKAASDYLNVTAGIRNVKVNAAGTNTTVINANVPLISGSDTTVLAVGRVANIEPLVLTDNNASPAAGNVKVRLVHASPAAGVVDIYVTAPGVDIASVNPTLANIPFKVASGYLEVPAGAYRVRITPVGQKIVAIDTGTLNLTAGQIRTGVAVGDPGVGQPLTAVLLADKN